MHGVPNLKFGRALGFFLLLLLYSRGGIAGSFEVNPIRIDLSGNTRSAALSVRNSGT